MTLGEGIYAYAKTVSAITAILGVGDAIQFYPIAAQEQKAPPVAFYEEDKDSSYDTQESAGATVSSVVTISLVATDTPTLATLEQAVRSAFAHLVNVLMGTVPVQGVLYQSSSPSYQWEEQQFAVDLKFKFWYVLS